MSHPAVKLIILPGSTDTLGGTLVTLSLLIKGFKQLGVQNCLSVLCRADSLMESYLRDLGHGDCLHVFPAENEVEFMRRAFQWVGTQPKHYPLMIDNCVARHLLPVLITSAPSLRLSGRPVYFFLHDLALSHNPVGYLLRKLAFFLLSPVTLCNSYFTASHVQKFVGKLAAILYQPVDFERFHTQVFYPVPTNLEPILQTGARVLITLSRINQPGIVNDKNLRSLIPVLTHLKALGHNYHSVILGEDSSPGNYNTQALLDSAEDAGVADRLTVLPPVIDVETYFHYATALVTLAPREPFGRTVVEAIACGVPVVGSNSGGVAEILNHFAPEWTVNPADFKSVAETIVHVVNDPQTPARLAAGQQWVTKECDVLDYVYKMTDITHLPISLPPHQEPILGEVAG